MAIDASNYLSKEAVDLVIVNTLNLILKDKMQTWDTVSVGEFGATLILAGNIKSMLAPIFAAKGMTL